MWVYDETKGWFHSPSALAETGIGGADRFPVRINALGLRGPELALDRAGDAGRVLVFGDSYVFGVGVAEDELLTTHLARLLAPHFPSGIEVVNLGVAGYSTDQQFSSGGARLAAFARSGDPGGLRQRLRREHGELRLSAVYKPYLSSRMTAGCASERTRSPLSRIQRSCGWTGSNVELREESGCRSPESAVSPSEARSRRLTTAAGALPGNRGPREILRPRGYDSRRLFLGDEHRQREEDAIPGTSRGNWRRRIHHLDLFPILDAARRREPNGAWDFRSDPHWNRNAHELAASSLVEYLRDHYLPSEARSR
jgi:hypothetical protein